ncbi:MAG: Septum site-determining protein MinD [Anaerolineae bacterium]|nr:Septum site-determining protein MinD [Anaerolineae bacterium]
MAGTVVTITSGKGGVGKTTTTANLGVALAKRGKRVACIDADIGLRNLDVVLGLENRIVYDIVDVVEGRARIRQALIKDKRLPELQMLPAAQTRDKTAVNPQQMLHLVEELKAEFDFVLIDSPAGIEHGFKNAVAPADRVLIVTTPEVSAVRDADRIIGMVEASEKPKPTLILNRLRPNMVKRGDMLATEDVLEILAIDLIGIIPEDESIITSTNRGQPVAFEGKTQAGQAYERIAARLLGEEVPFAVFSTSSNVLARFQKWFRDSSGGGGA